MDWYSEGLEFTEDMEGVLSNLTGSFVDSRFAVIDNNDAIELDTIYLDFVFRYALDQPSWESIDCDGRTTLICCQNYGESSTIYTYINGSFKAFRFTECVASTNNPLYYIQKGALLRFHPESNTISTVFSDSITLDKYRITDVHEYGDITVLSMYMSEHLPLERLLLIRNGQIINEYENLIANQFCISKGKSFRQIGYEIIVDDLKDFSEISRIMILPEDIWCICGTDNDSNINLVKYENMKSNEDNSLTYDVRFARISAPDFHLDIFKEAKLHVKDGLLPSNSLDFKKTRIMFLEYSNNPFRPFLLNSCNIKKDGVKQIYTLIADVSRFDVQIAPLEGDEYIIYANGNDEKDKKTMKPVMKVIDSNAGKTVKKYSDKTEGQMYGVEGYSISQYIHAFTLNNGRNVIAQFDKWYDHKVLSTDRYTGQKYPDKNGIDGVILTKIGDKVRIGLIDKESEMSRVITYYSDFDHTLGNPGKQHRLNVPIEILNDGFKYPAIHGNSIDLEDYSFNDILYKKAFITDNVRKKENEWSVDEPIPLMILSGAIRESDQNFPRPYRPHMPHSCKFYEIGVILCTLQLGQISNEVMASIRIVIDPENDDILSEFTYKYIELYYHDGQYAVSQMAEYGGNEISHLFRAELFAKDLKTAFIDNIVGKEESSNNTLDNDSIAITNGFTAVVKEGNDYIHMSTSNERTKIPVDDYPIGLFFDGELSISIVQNNDNQRLNKLIISKKNMVKSITVKECTSLKLLSENNGVKTFQIQNYNKDNLTVPDNINESEITEAKHDVNSNHFKVGNGTLYQHQGVYGFMKN